MISGGTMMLLGVVLYLVGGLVSLVGSIWLLVAAFQTSLGWGLAVLLLPVANIVFAVKHWAVAKKPFLLSLGGVVVIIIAVVLGGASFLSSRPVGPAPGANTLMAPPEPEVVPEKAVPQSNREKVAELLADAGIDSANPKTFQGRTVEEMKQALGPPSADMKMGTKTVFIFHNCFEVESTDGGKTVSSVHYMGQ